MDSSIEACTYPRANVAALELDAGGAAAEACRAVVEQFGLETAVDVLTASTDQEVLHWLADSPAGQAVRPADWSKLVRWASATETKTRKEQQSAEQFGAPAGCVYQSHGSDIMETWLICSRKLRSNSMPCINRK